VARPADTAAGVALIAGSAVAYSSAGFFSRLIDVDLWTLICWRGLFSTLFLLAISYALHRRGTITLFRSLDAAGWLAAGFSTAAMFCYLAALRNTTVADVAIIYGTAPFVTAAIALLLLGERSTRVTLLCSVLALPRRALPAYRSAVLAGQQPPCRTTRPYRQAERPADRRACALRDQPTWTRSAAADRRQPATVRLASSAHRRPGRAARAYLTMAGLRRNAHHRHHRRRTGRHRRRICVRRLLDVARRMALVDRT